MHRFAILVCALAPSIVFLQYGIAKARLRWNDAMVWEMYFSGGIAAVIALLPELLLKKGIAIDAMAPVHGAATEALFIAAIPEELAKFAMLFVAVRRYGGDTDRHDMITLSFAVALGFAAIENIGYLLIPGDWHLVALSRAGLSVPMHGLDGLAMGACLTAAGLSRLHRPGWLAAALVIPILMHALFDFPLMLVTRNSGFAGVLPAWILLETLLTIGVLWWCNNVRTAALHAYGLSHEPRSPWTAGILILLCAPLLALIALLQDSHAAITAVEMLIMPSIFGIDLLCTSWKSSYSTSVPFGTGSPHQRL
jgi:RsiW-degrading membrane proteinase PrsW (M82 family)